jgi:hypothetical protein
MYMKKSIINSLLMLVLFSFVTVSCLEDTGYTDIIDKSGASNPSIAINGNSVGLSLNTIGVKYLNSVQDVALFTLTAGRANADIVVTLKLDPEYLVLYNQSLAEAAIEAGDTTDTGEPIFEPFSMLPDSTYTIPSMNVTIPKGILDVDFSIGVNASKIQLGTKYLLPFTVESATGGAIVADNLKTAVRAIVVKNDFEGVYKSTGVRYNFNAAGDASITSTYPAPLVIAGSVSSAPWTFDETEILTIDASTGRCHVGNLNGAFGTINIVVNTDNSVTIVPTDDTGLEAVQQLPNYPSTYDPATKTFQLHYQYTNPNGTFRILSQKMVFVKDN